MSGSNSTNLTRGLVSTCIRNATAWCRAALSACKSRSGQPQSTRPFQRWWLWSVLSSCAPTFTTTQNPSSRAETSLKAWSNCEIIFTCYAAKVLLDKRFFLMQQTTFLTEQTIIPSQLYSCSRDTAGSVSSGDCFWCYNLAPNHYIRYIFHVFYDSYACVLLQNFSLWTPCTIIIIHTGDGKKVPGVDFEIPLLV